MTTQKVRFFETTGEAYDACQTDDNINDGDVLVITSERVVGVAGTWPIAITAEHGQFHTIEPGTEDREIEEEVLVLPAGCLDVARGIARDNGFDVRDETVEEDDDRAELTNAGAALEFITAGKAIFTIVSKKTGTRFTYKVSRPQRGGNLLFVGVLSGPDNNSNYTYLGFIPTDTPRVKLVAGNKGRSDAPSYRALDWTLRALARGMPEDLEIWHEGRCGRCNRRLTVPSSIETGFGPECANKVGL